MQIYTDKLFQKDGNSELGLRSFENFLQIGGYKAVFLFKGIIALFSFFFFFLSTNKWKAEKRKK